MKNKIIKLSSDLISFQSTKDNYQARQEILKYVKFFFKNEAVFIQEFDNNKVPSIIITLQDTKTPKIFLSGHLDVVYAKQADFRPKINDNKLYGRGSGDMKAACAVMMYVLKYFSQQKNRPSLGLMLTTDEEIGGFNGTGYLINKKKYSSDLAIIPDGGKDLKSIILNQKGVLHLKITAKGKSAHGAKPFWGENAIDNLINIYQRLRKEIPEVKKREWINTMNLGKISGGNSVNSVADNAVMYLDIRFIKPKDINIILSKLKKITKNFEIISIGNPIVQNRNHSYLSIYKKILEKELNHKIEFSKVEGSSDGRFFSENGSVCIVTKINTENIHSDNEWVDIAEAVIFYKTLIKFIKQI